MHACFTEYVQGARKAVTEEGEEKEATVPHFANMIIKDESDVLFGEIRSKFLVKEQYYSQLWDGWIEGYYTRRYRHEGRLTVYVVALMASSDTFFDVLNERFFKQGLGNRILWIIENIPEPKKVNSNDFFFTLDRKDAELQKLVEKVVNQLTTLNENAIAPFIFPDAAVLWADFQHACALKAHKATSLIGSFETKQPLNVLKLAVIYGASRLDMRERLVHVKKEDMQRAIVDVQKYTEMWRDAMKWWQLTVGKRKTSERRLETVKYDLHKMLQFGASQKDMVFSGQMVRGALDMSSIQQITKVLLVGRDKGWLEIVAETGEQGTLTYDQYQQFKKGRGFTPRVWQVTEKGKEESLKYKV